MREPINWQPAVDGIGAIFMAVAVVIAVAWPVFVGVAALLLVVNFMPAHP